MENKILATVNGKEISSDDVEMFIRNLGPQKAPQYQNEAGRQQILNELVSQNLFLADAKAQNLEEAAEYKAELSRMSEIILTNIAITRAVNAVQVSDTAVEEYFAANQSKYNAPESANTSHILVDDEGQCNDIYAKLVSGELQFADAAKEFSKCPSSAKGGELGMYARGQMVPEYDDVSFTLDAGEISKPVKTQFGWHIIRLNEKSPATTASLDDVRDEVTRELTTNLQREAYMARLEKLKKQFNVEMA
ncbi:MAG: peptidylprolyl isomerase [Candidatus Cloacimonetes bacterium]|nr:peptidylprolyl isomerase [Candidatus Cloacimonadota bacterium]